MHIFPKYFFKKKTGKPIETYYKENDTWHSIFGEVSSGYEECKADSVAIYLACFDDIL